MCADHSVSEAGQRGDEAELVEDGRPQLPGQKVDVSADLLRQGERFIDVGARRRRIAARLMALEREAQRGELLSELIVQIARDPAAFVLLGTDEPVEQIGHGFLGSLVAAHLSLELRGALLDAVLEFVVRRVEGVGGAPL